MSGDLDQSFSSLVTLSYCRLAAAEAELQQKAAISDGLTRAAVCRHSELERRRDKGGEDYYRQRAQDAIGCLGLKTSAALSSVSNIA